VQHLMNLRKLEYVDLTYTSISSHSYGVLLSELPSISNIVTTSHKCDVFGNISKQKLYTITQFAGLIESVNFLTEKCPNITRAAVYSLNQNLTNLTALTRLVRVKFVDGNHRTLNLNAVLRDVGHRFSDLCLRNVRNVNMADIVKLCSYLKSLVLKCCTFVPLRESAVLDTGLPQYRSLIQLKLIWKYCPQNDFRHLRHYVILELFECMGFQIVTDYFLHDALRQGAFRNIVRFWVERPSQVALTMRSFELLLQHCDCLREIGLRTSWSRLPLSE
jgi:hypothetical protein